MPSNLRLQTSFETQSFYPTSSTDTPAPKKQRMSLTQTYRIASSARSKLGREAGRSDHNLRLLVGHANLLDSLMIELADAEREQEAWFNETVRKNAKPEEPRRVQWIDAIAEEMDDEESDSDDDSDIYEEDMPTAPLRRMASPPPAQYTVSVTEEEDDEDESDADYEEDFDDDEEHMLTRVESHPPELVHEDSDSEDDSMPPSPPQPTMDFNEKQRQEFTSSAFFDTLQQPQHQQSDVVMNDFMGNNTNMMVAAC